MFLQLLLFTQHSNVLFAQRVFTSWAHIKPFLAVVEVADREVQVADATTRRIGLARHLTVTLKQFMQRLNELIELVRAAM